jgi:cation diffusion facilitator CzcD-associated flavoprotein CzcO
MQKSPQKRVCVIGAGIAGLVTAKILTEDGFQVVIFEKEPTIGGVWAPSRTYPGLRTNNPRETQRRMSRAPRAAAARASASEARSALSPSQTISWTIVEASVF